MGTGAGAAAAVRGAAGASRGRAVVEEAVEALEAADGTVGRGAWRMTSAVCETEGDGIRVGPRRSARAGVALVRWAADWAGLRDRRVSMAASGRRRAEGGLWQGRLHGVLPSFWYSRRIPS